MAEHNDETVMAGRLILLLERICFAKRPCKLCSKTIYLVRSNKAETLAMSPNGMNHEAECTGLKRKAQQATLIDTPQASALDPQR